MKLFSRLPACLACGAALLALALPCRAEAPASAVTHYKFDFGPGPVASGYVKVMPGDAFSAAKGYGFERGAALRAVSAAGGQPLTSDCLCPTTPTLFSVALPEGNYKVSLDLGNPQDESDTTVKAEMRRLMLEHVRTARGQIAHREFTVNIRRPEFPGGRVQLKKRELDNEMVNWDEKLTLEFNGAKAAVCSLAIEPAPADTIVVYILGDSTVCDQPGEPWNSWGQMLPRFFDAGVAVANHANSGESYRTSLQARRLDKVLSTMKRGDYLLMQFGHNDMKQGTVEQTGYRQSIEKCVIAARIKGAVPVIVSSVERKAGVARDTLNGYPQAAIQEARRLNVPYIDLHSISKALYTALGPQLNKAFQDGTHHNNYGSYEIAKCVVEAIRQEQLSLARHIVKDFKPFDPKHPDSPASFNLPASPGFTALKPLGN